MRTSRIAVTVCTGLLGLGTLVTQAVPAFAGPTPPMVIDQGGDSIEVGPNQWTTPTTQPTPDVPEMDLVFPEDEPDFQPPIGIPGEPNVVVDPDPDVPDGECDPNGEVADSDCNGCVPTEDGGLDCPGGEDECEPVPGGPDCPEDECVPDSTKDVPPWEQCPEDECEVIARAQIPPTADGGTDGGTDTGGTDDGDPCDEPCEERPESGPRDHNRPECCPTGEPGTQAARNLCDDDPCVDEGDRPGPQRSNDDECCPTGEDQDPQRHLVPEDEDCPETGTDGGDGGGTDGDGRLPKTGGEIVTYGLVGLGLTGLGALLKRLGRREVEEA